MRNYAKRFWLRLRFLARVFTSFRDTAELGDDMSGPGKTKLSPLTLKSPDPTGATQVVCPSVPGLNAKDDALTIDPASPPAVCTDAR